MLAKKITYTDYNGTERSETFHFNLSKAEVVEMEMGTTGGFVNMVQGIIDAQDGPSLMSIFKELILKAYGQKSPDGKRFIKNDAIREEFVQTEAYSQLFLELVTNDEAASNFIKAVLPSDMVEANENEKNGINEVPIK